MSLHELTDDQREIRELTRRFADEKIAPHAAQWDREHHFPRELFTELGELGLMGVCVPEEHGGAGADFLAYVLVLEELSRADAGVGVTVAVHTSAGHAADPQPRLAPSRSRELVPDARRAARSSPRSRSPSPARGSDAGAMRTRVDRRPHHRRQAVDHQRLLRLAPSSSSPRRTTSPSRLPRARRRRGLRVTREEEKMGLNSSSTADLAFEDTPAERLGEPGNGMRVALRTLDGGRIGIAAQAVGIAQAALELATGYAKERNAFGGPIARFQAIQHKLADMQTEIEAARALVWRAARLKEAGKPAQRRGRAGQALRLRASPAARPARRSRSSAATATPRSSPPSATTATPRSPRSTRARARSSGS